MPMKRQESTCALSACEHSITTPEYELTRELNQTHLQNIEFKLSLNFSQISSAV